MNYSLALIGFGGVNRALVKILTDKFFELKIGYDASFKVVAVSDINYGTAFDKDGLDLSKLASMGKEKNVLTTLPNGDSGVDVYELIKLSNANVVVEATFTDSVSGEPALSHCKAAINSNKHVVTTNKGPIALHLDTLNSLANEMGVTIGYEGTVMSGTPVINLTEKCLKGATPMSFSGILNGTANFILGEMESDKDMTSCIKQAQALGYAEADPTADIEGYDVMLKVTILSKIIFGKTVNPKDIDRKGITELTSKHIKSAIAQKKKWKLLGQARLDETGKVIASVKPALIDENHSLYSISGPQNALTITTDLLGETTVVGAGAGTTETAFALLTDILNIGETNECHA